MPQLLCIVLYCIVLYCIVLYNIGLIIIRKRGHEISCIPDEKIQANPRFWSG